MNNRPLIRKISYLIAIGLLIIPLSLISLPETRNADGTIKSAGGLLSQLRNEHNLSQAKLTEVDPTSETMKLASLGLRGVAVNILWGQAVEQKKNGDYDGLKTTLEALTKIQPNFIRVWEYQAHNMAYNVSMEFDDYEYRYAWVKKGLGFLKEGMRYNKQDHRITDNLGFFTGNKFGKSDEKRSFRRLFRSDEPFHNDMSDRLDPSDYDVREHGPDSWKMAYQWYNYSRNMVSTGVAQKKRNDVMFYMFRPAQLRNMGLSLQNEFPTRSVIQEGWNNAFEEWKEYGNQQLINGLGTRVTLDGAAAKEEELEKLRRKLDSLVPPETRRDVRQALLLNSPLTPEQQEEYKALIEIDIDQLSNDQQRRLRELERTLGGAFDRIDQEVALSADEKNKASAVKAANDIRLKEAELQVIGRDGGVVNYRYWDVRTKVESEQRTADAQLALHEAREVWKRSIFDDQFEYDYRTKKKTVIQKGAISLYEEAFDQWKPILTEHPRLYDGQLSERLVTYLQEYYEMLRFTNRDWPRDFPLQEMLDERHRLGDQDGLPISAQLEQEDSEQEDSEDEDLEDEDLEAEKPVAENPDAEDAEDAVEPDVKDAGSAGERPAEEED